MAAKSPTMSVKSREMIGVDQFSQRREVFDKHDTVFLPLSSPTNVIPVYREVEPIITSNHGKTTANFKRNTATTSSMRESGTDERIFDFRPRKYSDNFTSELHQSDDVEYRHTMTERTRRLSKLRRDFMTSNLHEPGSTSPFNRSGTRASLPVTSYKIESPNLYKFPFAEPYSTPTPVRKVIVDLGPSEVDSGKENQDPEKSPDTLNRSSVESPSNIDHQKLFEELVKRYSPQRKPIDWKLPPTKPRVVASVPKSSSSVADSIDSGDKTVLDVKPDKADDDVFVKKENGDMRVISDSNENADKKPNNINSEIVQNGPESPTGSNTSKDRDTKTPQSELDEKRDKVPELLPIPVRELPKKPAIEPLEDLSMPALIEKINAEGEDIEKKNKTSKKVKRKRSFLDKLLGRKKNK